MNHIRFITLKNFPDRLSGPSHSWMEAVMPSSITRLVVGIAVAYGVAVVRQAHPTKSAARPPLLGVVGQRSLLLSLETRSSYSSRCRCARPSEPPLETRSGAIGA